jgi:hypothetical protein
MIHNYWDLGHQPEGAVVRVDLEGDAANVKLLDSSNYRSYAADRQHRYFGGHYDRSPVMLPVPSGGHWYVAIDYGGGAGRGRASVQVLVDA